MTDFAFDLTVELLDGAVAKGAAEVAATQLARLRDSIKASLPADEHYRRTQIVSRAARQVAAMSAA